MKYSLDFKLSSLDEVSSLSNAARRDGANVLLK